MTRESIHTNDRYDIRQFDWRVLVTEHIGGKCLDLFAGYGTRSCLLSELCDEVYAVDQRDDQLQHLQNRPDFNHENIHPISAEIDELPFSEGSFDVIVASDLEALNWTCSGMMQEKLANLQMLLKDEGSLIINLPGWPTASGIGNLLSLEQVSTVSPLFDRLLSSVFTTPAYYERLFRSLEFISVNFYTHLPTPGNIHYSFNIDGEEIIPWLIDRYYSNNNIQNSLARNLCKIDNKVGILRNSYPSFLTVASKGNSPNFDSVIEKENVLVSHGRSRAAILQLNKNSVENVIKIPNRTRHIKISNREDQIISTLNEDSSSITADLPEGRIIETRFGPARLEKPASGTPLSSKIQSSSKEFERVLRIGLNWIIKFQQNYRDTTSTFSTKDIRDHLILDKIDVHPPFITSESDLHPCPVHGDFHPQNVYVEGESVETVIDWEHSYISGNPLIDPTFFLLQTSRFVFDGLETGFRQIFLRDTKYAKIARNYIRLVCTELEIDVETFLLHLPSGWIHQLGIEYEIESSITYTKRPAEKREWINFVWERIEQIEI